MAREQPSAKKLKGDEQGTKDVASTLREEVIAIEVEPCLGISEASNNVPDSSIPEFKILDDNNKKPDFKLPLLGWIEWVDVKGGRGNQSGPHHSTVYPRYYV